MAPRPQPPSISVRVFESLREIVPLLERTGAHSGATNPTLARCWLEGLEATGCVQPERGWIPHHVAAFAHHAQEGAAPREELLFVAPAYLKLNSEGEFIFDHGIARAAPKFGVQYFPKLLFAVPFTPATGPRMLLAEGADAALARDAFALAISTLVDKLELSSAHVLFLPGDEAEEAAKRGLLHRHSLQFHWQNRGYTTFEEFLGALPSKRRTQIRRERRAPAEQGLTIETLTGDALTPEIADLSYELYLTTVDKFAWGRRYLNRAFFEHVLSTMKRDVELVVARRGAKVIAGAFNLRSATTRFGRYWGAFEEVPFLHFNVCFYHSIERSILEGVQTFEPGAGGEHKLARGFEPTVTHSVHVLREPRFRAVVADFFERERDAIQSEISG